MYFQEANTDPRKNLSQIYPVGTLLSYVDENNLARLLYHKSLNIWEEITPKEVFEGQGIGQDLFLKIDSIKKEVDLFKSESSRALKEVNELLNQTKDMLGKINLDVNQNKNELEAKISNLEKINLETDKNTDVFEYINTQIDKARVDIVEGYNANINHLMLKSEELVQGEVRSQIQSLAKESIIVAEKELMKKFDVLYDSAIRLSNENTKSIIKKALSNLGQVEI